MKYGTWSAREASAPAASSVRTAGRLPFMAALCRAVHPDCAQQTHHTKHSG